MPSAVSAAWLFKYWGRVGGGGGSKLKYRNSNYLLVLQHTHCTLPLNVKHNTVFVYQLEDAAESSESFRRNVGC